MADIRVTFVLPKTASDESDASESMIQAYESCRQLVDNISWVKESELNTKKFNKLDYIVFENFDGRDFSDLIQNKCARIVGPLAVSVCLMEGKPIPSFQWPIQNVAMYGCQVTCSQISKTAKELIKDRVQLMGGLYTGNFIHTVTHLICGGTRSEKYMLAAEKGVQLMLPEWVDYVFEASQSKNVNANDSQILKKYKCPPFYKLTICSTGITSNKDKKTLSELISENGGKMVARLNFSETDVLLCHGAAGTTSEKFKAAKRNSLPCVTLDWVNDSVEKGYALPYEKHYVKHVTSTPNKEGENVDPNFSTISYIGIHQKTTINETISTTEMSTATKRSSNKRKAEDLIEKIDIKKVKSAGQFLDGCSIFVAGFSPEHRDKLNKIVNLSGATRYDEFSDRVTHVIVGDPNCSEVTSLAAKRASCALVSVEWLLDSVEQQRPTKEDKYLITSRDLDEDGVSRLGSPLSKKALNLLKNSNPTVDTKKDKEENEEKTLEPTTIEHEDPLTQHYLKNATTEKTEDTLAMLLKNQDGTMSSRKEKSPEEEFKLKTRSFQGKNVETLRDNNQTLEFRPNETSTQVSQVTSNMTEDDTDMPIFSSYTFYIDGFNEEEMEAYKEYILGVDGTIVDKQFKGVVNYAVVPILYQSKNLPTVQEIVNDLWIIQCLEEERVCDILYYHRPVSIPSTTVLNDCVVTISIYTGQERNFLKSVIERLGGIFQEQFSRKNIPAKSVLASTHLVSPEASGKKYEAALKWNLPVVNKDWLLECARTGTKVDVEQYLLGDISSDKSSDQSNNSKNGPNIGSSGSKTSTPPKQVSNECKSINATKENNSSTKKIGVSTPVGINKASDDAMKTPIHQVYNLNQKDTPEVCSQVTPINKIVQDAINDKVLPTPPSPRFPWDPKTPDTPIGAFIRPNPSPRLRKEMQKYLDSFPDFVPPKKRLSTPLSELKRRLRDKVLGRGEYSQDRADDAGPSTQEHDKPVEVRKESTDMSAEGGENAETASTIENVAVHQKLQVLQQMVMANSSSGSTRRSSRMFADTTNPPGIVTANNEVQSQVCTVGWDYGENETQTQPQKLFLFSGIDVFEKEEMSKDVRNLGGIVLESNSYDPACTHLICRKPGRNEKTLACMAGGKWILHFSYVEKCVKAGKFLNEEEFEFGNPNARQNISYEEKDNSISYWRKEIKRRGYGAFNDMRAIIVAEKKELIANVIEAGGGVIVHVTPPFEDTVHATHCLLEMKLLKDFSKYIPLAQQGIKCVNTIYVNDFLWRNKKEDSDYIVPYFAKYY